MTGLWSCWSHKPGFPWREAAQCPGCSRLLLSLAFQQTGEHYGAYIDHYHPPGSSKRGPADASRKMRIVACKRNVTVYTLFQMWKTRTMYSCYNFKHMLCFKRQSGKAPVLAWELTCNRFSELSQNVCIHSIGIKNCFKYQNIEVFRNFMPLNWPKFISKRYHQTLTYYVSYNCQFTETWEECLFFSFYPHLQNKYNKKRILSTLTGWVALVLINR